jgi:hypothetical protein
MAISSQGYTFNLGSQVETEAFPVTVLTKGNVIGGIFIMVCSLERGCSVYRARLS